MIMRLETVAKELVEKLEAASEEQRRNAVIVACELAFKMTPVDVPVVIESLEKLRSGNKLTIEQKSELDGLAEKLDAQYLDLQDSLDERQDIDAQALHLFSQARAISALSLSGGDDSLISATEAIYEASSAVDDGKRIFDAVLLVLSGA